MVNCCVLSLYNRGTDVAALKLMASAVQRLLCIVVKKRKEIRHWSPDSPPWGKTKRIQKELRCINFMYFSHISTKSSSKQSISHPLIILLLGSDGPCFHQCHGHVDHDLYPHVKSAMPSGNQTWLAGKAPFYGCSQLKNKLHGFGNCSIPSLLGSSEWIQGSIEAHRASRMATTKSHRIAWISHLYLKWNKWSSSQHHWLFWIDYNDSLIPKVWLYGDSYANLNHLSSDAVVIYPEIWMEVGNVQKVWNRNTKNHGFQTSISEADDFDISTQPRSLAPACFASCRATETKKSATCCATPPYFEVGFHSL